MRKPKFQIGTSTDTAYELKRTIELQLLYVASLFDPLKKDVGQVIHLSRQTCKKCRAILRLMRDSMGYAAYYRENTNLRDLQRELARFRDADVQLQVFRRLSGNLPEHTRKRWFAGLMEEAKKNYELELDHLMNGDRAAQIADRFRSTAAQMKTYPLSGQGFGLIEKGLSRIYRQGRGMGYRVYSEDAGEHEVHDLRKKAKYLQHQLFYLSALNKALITAMSTTLEQLTENLGYYNDLRLASNSMKEYAKENHLTPEDYGILLEGLKEEMQKLKSDSRQIYVNVYSEPTRAFIRRIRRYWEAFYGTVKYGE
jgi:CHAD domain-containing protein